MSRCVRHMHARGCASATSASTSARAVLVCMPSARGLMPPPRQDSCMRCKRVHACVPARARHRYAPVAKAGYYGVRWATAKDVAYTFHACAPGRCLQASGSVWAVLARTKYTTFTRSLLIVLCPPLRTLCRGNPAHQIHQSSRIAR